MTRVHSGPIDSVPRLSSPKRRSVAHDDARALLDAYREGDAFFFTSPRGTRSARTACGEITAPLGGGALSRAARAELARASGGSIVAGALAFDPAAPSSLALFTAPEIAGPLPKAAAQAGADRVRISNAHAQPSRGEYARAVAALTHRMREGELDKAVLAQRLELICEAPPDAGQVLRALAAQNPQALCFAVRGGGAPAIACTLLGASPELLVEKRGRRFCTHPLAGSIPRSPDPDEDRRLALGLERSAKDLKEHRLVTSAVARALAPLARRIQIPTQPTLIATPTMWHLATRIDGELAHADTTALDLVTALHPTPAVCGSPVARAREALAAFEGFDRGLFAGAVGYCDTRGDGEWAVTIRCAELCGHKVRLFAGAGIVAESNPERECAEVGAKLRTMLRALGLEPDAAGRGATA